MLLLSLTLFFHCGLLRCGDCEKADFNRPLLAEHEKKARRTDIFMNDSITNVLLNSTPGTVQSEHLTPQYYLLTNPLFTKTYGHDTDPASLAIPLFPDPDYLEPTHLQDLPVYPPVFGPTVHIETTVDPSAAEYAKKWLQDIASSTADTKKLLVPKLSQILDYDFATDGLPLTNRRNQKTSQRKIGHRQFENNPIRHQTRPIVRQRTTVPQISERRNLESEAKTSWPDPARRSRESDSHRIERTQTLTTATKQRLKPGLLLGMATIGDDRNPDDNSEFEKITSAIDENKRILRVHELTSMKKKECYSEVQLEQMGAQTHKNFVRHTIFPTPTTCSYMNTASSAQSHHKTSPQEFRQDSHMISFLLELTRLIAEKEETAVYDVVKHTDQIIRGLYKNRLLQWFDQPLIDVTQYLARSLKESEIDVTQKQAAELHHKLRQRRQMLSEEVNTILDYADKLYDDDEGVKLSSVLNEFGAYPNVTLNGYWLCNSLINNFLRPYRRFKHTRQRQKLIDSVNKALKTRFASIGFNETTALQKGDVTQANISPDETQPSTKKQPEDHTDSQTETIRYSTGKKRKRRHRSRVHK